MVVYELVLSPSCHAPWAKDSLDNFKQFPGSAEFASSESETTNQITLFAIRNSITWKYLSCHMKIGLGFIPQRVENKSCQEETNIHTVTVRIPRLSSKHELCTLQKAIVSNILPTPVQRRNSHTKLQPCCRHGNGSLILRWIVLEWDRIVTWQLTSAEPRNHVKLSRLSFSPGWGRDYLWVCFRGGLTH